MIGFLGQAIRDYRQTGAVMPSSARLAREMTHAARVDGGPRRVLEVGPGTGAFTRLLLEGLRDGDELHVVEVSPTFCRLLEERHLVPHRAAQPAATVHLHCGPIEHVPLAGRFDVIVCGLPFNNFPLPLVRTIFQRLLDLLAPDGDLTYFEYVGMRAIKAPLVGAQGRRSLRRRGAEQAVLFRRHRGRRRLVLANVPPAFAVHLRGRAAAAAATI